MVSQHSARHSAEIAFKFGCPPDSSRSCRNAICMSFKRGFSDMGTAGELCPFVASVPSPEAKYNHANSKAPRKGAMSYPDLQISSSLD